MEGMDDVALRAKKQLGFLDFVITPLWNGTFLVFFPCVGVKESVRASFVWVYRQLPTNDRCCTVLSPPPGTARLLPPLDFCLKNIKNNRAYYEKTANKGK